MAIFAGKTPARETLVSPVILAVEPAASGSRPRRPALGGQQDQVLVVPAFPSVGPIRRQFKGKAQTVPEAEMATKNTKKHKKTTCTRSGSSSGFFVAFGAFCGHFGNAVFSLRRQSTV